MHRNQQYSISTKSSTLDNHQRIKSSTYSRTLILNRNHDKETLGMQNYQLQIQVNQLRDELNAAKIKCYHLEKEQNIIENKKPQGQSLIKNLKKQLKQSESNLLNKYSELECLKKDTRSSKLQELEVELKQYQEETIRLRKVTEQQEKILSQYYNYNNSFSFEKKTIETLYKQNFELMKETGHHKQLTMELQYNNEQLEVEISLRDREIKRLIRQIQENNQLKQQEQNNKKSRQQIYRESIERAQLLSRIEEVEKQLLEQIKQKDEQIEKLSEEIQLKNNIIQKLEKEKEREREREREKVSFSMTDQINESQNDSISQGVYPLYKKDSKSSLFSTQQNQRLSILSNKQQKRMTIQLDQVSKTKSKMEGSQQQFNNIQEFYEDQLNSDDRQERKNRQLSTVHLYEVQEIGRQIKFDLQFRQIPLIQIENQLLEYQELSINDLIQILNGDPFFIDNLEQRKLLSRYLVEDNNDEYIEYDPYRISNILYIKSVMRQLLYRYELFTDFEEKKLEKQIAQIFNRILFQLNDIIHQLGSKKKYLRLGTCEKIDFEVALKTCDACLTNRQLEYLYYLNYCQFQSLEIIHYKDILDRLLNKINDNVVE